MNEIITGLTTKEKLNILADAAKYDVACTSSGVDRKGQKGALGNSVSCGICHSFAADGRCISLLKVLMTNHCVYDCKYCLNRRSNDVPRATFEPEELCDLVEVGVRRAPDPRLAGHRHVPVEVLGAHGEDVPRGGRPH